MERETPMRRAEYANAQIAAGKRMHVQNVSYDRSEPRTLVRAKFRVFVRSRGYCMEVGRYVEASTPQSRWDRYVISQWV